MSSVSNRSASISDNGENTCVVCFKNVKIYSIGICDHPVCFECSTRMRVLCKQMECPICRQEMNKVVFVQSVKPFQLLAENCYSVDRNAAIYFETPTIHESYKKLLTHACNKCPNKQVFPNFALLKDHMKKEHERYFCELCIENLKIFTWERRYYTRQELATHRRKGDPDNTSHRGHPLCDFCDQRYVDDDELFRHLRREHFFCHFCDADGLNQYYCTYEDLREHFRESHFLCEEGECKEEKFTRVFRTDIDLRAHKAQNHSQSLGKAAAKQARMLELEFTLAPRSSESRNRGQRRGAGPRTREREREEMPVFNGEESTRGAAANITDHQEFPSLVADQIPVTGGTNTSDSLAQKIAKSNRFTVRSSRRNGANGDEEFPSLISSTSEEKSNQKADGGAKRSVYVRLSSQEDQVGNTRTGSSNLSIQLTQSYPPPIAQNLVPPQPRVTRVSSSQNIRVQPSPGLQLDTDFPSLVSQQQQQQAQTNWLKKEPVKPAAKPASTKIAPVKAHPSLNPEDFPTLGLSSATPATSISWGPGKAASKAAPVNKAPALAIPVAETVTEQTKGRTKKKKTKSHSEVNGTADAVEIAGRKVSEMQIGKLKSLSSHMGGASLDLVAAANLVEEKAPIPSKVGVIKAETKTPETSGVKPKAKPLQLTEQDFPALGTSGGPSGHQSLFDKGTSTSSRTAAVLTPGDLTPTKVTFTSSSGLSFPLPVEQIPVYNFLQPPDFAARNKALITTITDLLGERQTQFNQFRSLSSEFRSGLLTPEEYYQRCLDIMGKDCFMALFPELLVLLPDIEKQQLLLKVYRSKMKHSGKAAYSEPFIICATCSQILFPSDVKHHISSHNLETNFPVLNPSSNSSSAWGRR